MALEIDSYDAAVASDGALLAENWHCFACESCDFYHFELFDRNGKRFAALVVGPEDMVPLAQRLMEHAANLAKDGKLTLPGVH